MKNYYAICLLSLSWLAQAQAPVEKIQSYLNDNRQKLNLSAQDVQGWMVESEASSTVTKINNYYLKQRHNGIEIFSAVNNVWVKNGEVINMESQFIPNVAQKVNAVTPTLSVTQAATKAFQSLGVQMPDRFDILSSEGNKNFTLSNGALTEDPITAELTYQPMDDSTLRLAWDFTFYTQDHHHLWSVRIDALNGEMLDKYDMVISCNFHSPQGHTNHNHVAFNKHFYKDASMLDIQSGSYRVIPYNVESPAHGPRQLISTPHNALASPYGWHDTNGAAGTEFTTSRGNNVLAAQDADGNNNTAGVQADGGASLLFDFPYGGNSVEPETYVNASVTNLFYMNNILHDVMYQYGFDEVNGNFQQNNYGRGGTTTFFGDAVQADAQDGNGEGEFINNANFATPVDGQRPRMQMYLWNAPPRFFFVTAPGALVGSYQSVQNAFNPGHVPVPTAPAQIQTDLVLYQDVSATTNEACVLPSNAAQMAGKIVLIRRGNCDFVIKVKNAQDAGAVAVVMTDNLPMQLVSMAGADASITIPAVFITKELGDALIAAMQTGTVNIKLSAPAGDPYINADGDFDNGIISHEYGHGISTRLTGGPANSSCLFNDEAMGEGWSDWFALMMQLKAGDNGSDPKGIAAFAASQPLDSPGIRSFVYSTDMTLNPRTLSYSNSTSANYRYDVGEVWASMLWDLTWAYIEKYGFDPNIYTGTGGNNKVMRLVLDALKLQSCNPGFVAGRNAIIAADQATTGGEDYCMIWSVFARRGLGLNASSGLTSNANDQVENFTEPAPGPNCTLGVNFINGNVIRVYPNPSNGQMTLRINNFSGKASVSVFDVNGRKVYFDETDFNQERAINLQHLQSGMYVLKVTADNLDYTQKIILN